MSRLTYFIVIISFLLLTCSSPDDEEITEELADVVININDSSMIEAPPEDSLGYIILDTIPRNINAFTQGLTFFENNLYEGTGRDSWIARVDQITGEHQILFNLEPNFFGEGITILNGKLYQLTWKNEVGFIYNLDPFSQHKNFNYKHEGWGITHDGTELIVSDGSHRIYFYDSTSLTIQDTILVTEEGKLIDRINELEYIDNHIFANRWFSDIIFKIDPNTGTVINKYNFSAISQSIKADFPLSDVLNGIAYNPFDSSTMITGKLWPYMYKIMFTE